MPFAHERRHDETTITDFGAAPVHDRGDTGCQCLDLVQKQPQPNLRFGELIPGQVQSLMFRQPQHRRTKLGQGARHGHSGHGEHVPRLTLVAATEAHSTVSKVRNLIAKVALCEAYLTCLERERQGEQ